ncbi:MAG: hypothetical protein LBQ98_00975, partial [Nitrososphaerota archaeon]|nr:hypothetical protein [Nitrososphaerota archaeon]
CNVFKSVYALLCSNPHKVVDAQLILNHEINTAFEELITQIKNTFKSKQGQTSAKKYLTGLLSQTKRKNN